MNRIIQEYVDTKELILKRIKEGKPTADLFRKIRDHFNSLECSCNLANVLLDDIAQALARFKIIYLQEDTLVSCEELTNLQTLIKDVIDYLPPVTQAVAKNLIVTSSTVDHINIIKAVLRLEGKSFGLFPNNCIW